MGYRGSLNFHDPIAPPPRTSGSTLAFFGYEAESGRFMSSYATFFNPAKSAQRSFAAKPRRIPRQEEANDKLPSLTLNKSQSDSVLRQVRFDPSSSARTIFSQGASSRQQTTSRGGMLVSEFGSSSGSGVLPPIQGTLPSNPRQSQRRNAVVSVDQKTEKKFSFAADKQRAIMELLTNPNLEGTAKGIFNAHDTEQKGYLGFQALRSVLHTLHVDLGLSDASDDNVAERLFKKFDVDNSGTLQFKEFMELFLAILRRNAFDRYTLLGRNFFVNESQGDIWDDFEKKKQLGGGSFGTAWLVKNKLSSEERVVKVIKKTRLRVPVSDAEKEVMVMRQLDHPHVVRLFRWYEDPSQIYLVMEALAGGTLNEAILRLQKQEKEIPESWIRTVIYQVLEGMAYCHSLRLIHKDLKDENIMLAKSPNANDEPFAVIIDLGIAEMFSLSDPHCRQISGTPYTMAPEVWMGTHGPKCDVWSLGCVLFELLAGSLPFKLTGGDFQSPHAWLREHRKGPKWGLIKLASGGKDLCEAMLTISEDKRPSMQDCLAHEWFSAAKFTLGSIKAEQFLPLQKFCQNTALKRSILLEIASKLPISSAGRIVDIFERFDTDKSGGIELEELQAAFRSMGLNDDKMAKKTFEAMDVNRDGNLSFSEFAAGVLPLFTDLLDDRLHALFMQFDSAQEGALNYEDAKRFLANAASLLKKSAVARSANILDSLLQDGRVIRYEELRDKLLDLDFK